MNTLVVDAHALEPELEYWPIEDLVPYEGNQKIHSQESIEKLAAVIKRQGMLDAIIVDGDGVIIAGHRRRLAQLHNGATKVAVRCWRGISKVEAEEKRISSNKEVNDQYDDQAMADSVAFILENGEDDAILNLGMDQDEMAGLLSDSESSLEALSAVFSDTASIAAVDARSSSGEAPTSSQDSSSTSEVKPDLSEDYKPAFQLQITLETEKEQEDLYTKLADDGYDVKVMTA